jgi:hypothetical protein
MIVVNCLAAQGDVLFRRIAELPPEVIEVRPMGTMVVAHSETGHHHIVLQAEVRLFEKQERDPLLCFLSVDSEFADIVHLRSFDTHEPLRLTTGVWEVRRQREWRDQKSALVLD